MNDDMDELFRRAAEHYPLETEPTGWDKVSAALKAGEKPKDGNSLRLLWLMFLVPLTFLCNRNLETGSARSTLTPSVNPTLPVSAVTPDPIVSSKDPASANYVAQPGGSVVRKKSIQTASVVTSRIETRINTIGLQHGTGSGQDELTAYRQPATATLDVLRERKPMQGRLRHFDIPLAAIHPLPELIPENTSDRKPSNVKRFYTGVTAGLDFTTVHFQEIRHAGKDLGITAGYFIGKKLSLEAGIYSNQKFYYSEGYYYNTSRLYMPPNSKVTDVSGVCKMYEGQLNLRYHFHSASSGEWQGAAGISSYLMTREDYRYTYYYANSGSSAVHEKTYKSRSFTPAAAAFLSAGYQKSLGRDFGLRIEPYAKIPLRRMGSGRMSLFSTGLHASLIKSFR